MSNPKEEQQSEDAPSTIRPPQSSNRLKDMGVYTLVGMGVFFASKALIWLVVILYSLRDVLMVSTGGPDLKNRESFTDPNSGIWTSGIAILMVGLFFGTIMADKSRGFFRSWFRAMPYAPPSSIICLLIMGQIDNRYLLIATPIIWLVGPALGCFNAFSGPKSPENKDP